jgi:hypothetical protein
VMTIDPSGQAQPHRTGGGGSGGPFFAMSVEAPSKAALTETTAAIRTNVFIELPPRE